jgi:hypothetical protein
MGHLSSSKFSFHHSVLWFTCLLTPNPSMQRSDLLSNATVVAYLGSMEVTQNDLVDDQAPNQEQADEPMHEGEEDDFS